MTSEHHLSLCYPSVLILVLVRVENVQLMWHNSCAGTLQMTQIPARKTMKRMCVGMADTQQCVLEGTDMHCGVAWMNSRAYI